jgi:hypothetical protein
MSRRESSTAVPTGNLVVSSKKLEAAWVTSTGWTRQVAQRQVDAVVPARSVERLAAALEEHHRQWVAADADSAAAAAEAQRRLERSARLGATEELDARLGRSLDRLDGIVRHLEPGER